MANVMIEFDAEWVRAILDERFTDGGEGFDRWLAKHDAEVAAKALSDVSASIKQERPEMGMHILPTPYRDGKCHGLDLAESIVRARATEYRKAVQS